MTVLRAKDIRVLPILRDEVPISRQRLEELEDKARAHDAYLEAARIMGQRRKDTMDKLLAASLNGHQSKVSWSGGWLACLREFNEAVLEAVRRAG